MEQSESKIAGAYTPDECFEFRALMLRNVLAAVFSGIHDAEVCITDGKKSAKFQLRRDEYDHTPISDSSDLDPDSAPDKKGYTNKYPLILENVTDIQELIRRIADDTSNPEQLPKGIVAIDGEVEEIVKASGMQVKFGELSMPYACNHKINYYTGK